MIIKRKPHMFVIDKIRGMFYDSEVDDEVAHDEPLYADIQWNTLEVATINGITLRWVRFQLPFTKE